jgi:enamine deaminase RidA (YjgF/YER057c/UK114 family)|tara:strand:- start:4143 stop:4607 length:465 start_codon:yes stop_codon:yes gene_type:complete
MSITLEKIQSLNISLPKPTTPVANYVGYVKSGNMVFISGQLPIKDGELQFIGKVGKEISIEDATKAAQLCTINILSQLNDACANNLDKVKKCIKLGIFVNGIEEFADHPKVANGASDLIADIFGDKGKHARAAVGSGSLPFNVSVEVDAIFEIE